MKLKKLACYIFIFTLFYSCKNDKDKRVKKDISITDYKNLKEQILKDSSALLSDSANIFDSKNYDPKIDTVDKLLIDLGNVYEKDSNFIVKFDIRSTEELGDKEPVDTIIINKEVFTRNLHDITEPEIEALKYNLNMVHNAKTNDTLYAACRRDSCPVYAHVSKKNQRMYLYINGTLLDTFRVSTGDAKHKTPNFDTKPNGLMFKKYTSKKYPGGNWNGLGNMPYVVFINGGYGIHGTTVGNIKRLGNAASHGCVRLHPNNARIFFELVQMAGPENTWITIDDI